MMDFFFLMAMLVEEKGRKPIPSKYYALWSES